MPDSSSEELVPDTGATEVVNEAESAPAPEEDTRSALDVLSEVLDPEGVNAESPPAESRSEPADAEPKDGEGEKDDGEISEEEIKQYTPNAQNRIRELAAQKNDLRGQLEQFQAEAEPLRVKAESFDTLQGYLVEHGISSQEANNALEITRLIKSNDYEAAYGVLRPIFEDLHRRVGGVLDADLQEEVRLGHLPKQRALELQRGRASQAATREREETRTQREQAAQQQRQQQDVQRHVASMAKFADDWGKQKAETDPDWNQKQDFVAAELNVILRQEGFPRTREQAVKMSEKALANVEARLKGFRPRPTPINANNRDGAPASTREQPAPKTPLEALERGLAAANS